MNSFGKSPASGRRAAPRATAPLLVELSIGGAKQSAILSEISRTGAKLRGTRLIDIGEELIFRAGSVQAPGQVVWSEGDQCAIAFDIPIAPGEVGRLRSLASFVTKVGRR